MKTQNQNNLLEIVDKIEYECSALSKMGQRYDGHLFITMIDTKIDDLKIAIYNGDYGEIAKLSNSLKEKMENRVRTNDLPLDIIEKDVNPLFEQLDKTALSAQREENQTPLQNSVVQGFKDGSISLSTLRLLKTSMSAEELKVFVNSEIDDKGKRMLHLTEKKEIADFLISAGASKIDKSYVESQNTSTGPSKMKERLENRDNIPDFPDVPKTTSQFGNVKSQSTLNKGSETIRMTKTQFVLLDNLTDPKASIVKFKEIMEGNSGKFFRDNINADLDGKGNTLLHLVKNEDIREYLIAEHKANPRARNNEGKTYDGGTYSKEKEFAPKTETMDTLKFEKNEPQQGSRRDLRKSDIRIGAHRKVPIQEPKYTNQTNILPQRPPLESKKTQYGQLFSDKALAKKQNKAQKFASKIKAVAKNFAAKVRTDKNNKGGDMSK